MMVIVMHEKMHEKEVRREGTTRERGITKDIHGLV